MPAPWILPAEIITEQVLVWVLGIVLVLCLDNTKLYIFYVCDYGLAKLNWLTRVTEETFIFMYPGTES